MKLKMNVHLDNRHHARPCSSMLVHARSRVTRNVLATINVNFQRNTACHPRLPGPRQHHLEHDCTVTSAASAPPRCRPAAPQRANLAASREPRAASCPVTDMYHDALTLTVGPTGAKPHHSQD